MLLPLHFSMCPLRFSVCEDYEHRKDWIEARLEELTRYFAVDVCGYALLASDRW